MASTYVLLICAPLNALMNYVLVWVCNPFNQLPAFNTVLID